MRTKIKKIKFNDLINLLNAKEYKKSIAFLSFRNKGIFKIFAHIINFVAFIKKRPILVNHTAVIHSVYDKYLIVQQTNFGKNINIQAINQEYIDNYTGNVYITILPSEVFKRKKIPTIESMEKYSFLKAILSVFKRNKTSSGKNFCSEYAITAMEEMSKVEMSIYYKNLDYKNSNSTPAELLEVVLKDPETTTYQIIV